jgi:hypothetical protein
MGGVMANWFSLPREATPSPEDLVCGQILAACREGDCPICGREADTVRRSLEALLHEQVTDPLIRRRLRQSHGLCPAHTRLLASLPHANLAVAVIYQDLLRAAHEQLRLGLAAGTGRVKRPAGAIPLAAWHRAKAACPVCLAGEARVASDLAVILQHFVEPAFRDRFARSAGLCLPHLAHLVEIGSEHPTLPAVLAWHEARWRELDAELGEFARKFDYRYAAEPMGRERDSWLRVLRLFVGTRNILPGGWEAGPTEDSQSSEGSAGCQMGAGEPRPGE